MSQDPSEQPQDPTLSIDWRDLSEEALRNVLEDLVSRGEPDEMGLEARCRQLMSALKQGKAKLYFDPVEEAIFLRS